MSEFLSSEWFDETNVRLQRAGALSADIDETIRVVFELADEPASAPHAFTLSLGAEGARLELGDHLAARTVVRLRYADAKAIATGSLDGANALREGRLKIRGDVSHFAGLLEWLTAALATRDETHLS